MHKYPHISNIVVRMHCEKHIFALFKLIWKTHFFPFLIGLGLIFRHWPLVALSWGAAWLLFCLPGLGGHSGEGVSNMGSLLALPQPCAMWSEETYEDGYYYYCHTFLKKYIIALVIAALTLTFCVLLTGGWIIFRFYIVVVVVNAVRVNIVFLQSNETKS